MKKAIVIGCSSGIGQALVRVLAGRGYEVGLAGRRVEAMKELARELPTATRVKKLDLREPDDARQALMELIAELGDVDVIIINSGIGGSAPTWAEEREMMAVNVIGFATMARQAMEYFLARGSGHLLGISSIAALRGVTTAYSGSKAFVSRYLEGLQFQADGLGVDVTVTDVKPGYVATPMTDGRKDMFWVCTTDVAAEQIYAAIVKRKRLVYVTRRWRLMAWVMKALPHWLASWLHGRRRQTPAVE